MFPPPTLTPFLGLFFRLIFGFCEFCVFWVLVFSSFWIDPLFTRFLDWPIIYEVFGLTHYLRGFWIDPFFTRFVDWPIIYEVFGLTHYLRGFGVDPLLTRFLDWPIIYEVFGLSHYLRGFWIDPSFTRFFDWPIIYEVFGLAHVSVRKSMVLGRGVGSSPTSPASSRQAFKKTKTRHLSFLIFC